MRILCFCSGAILSGKEFVSLETIDAWQKSGHDVEVIFIGWHDGKFQQKLDENNIINHPVKLGWYYISNFIWSFDSLINYLPAILQFRRIYKKFNPDFLYVDSYRQIVLLWPFLKKNILYHVNDPVEAIGERYFLKFIQKKVLKFIAASQFIADALTANNVDSEKVMVIHNGVKVTHDLQKQYLPNGKIRIGLVGQIIARKGHLDVIEACNRIKDEAQFEIYIYGSGNEDYIRQIKDKVVCYGLIDRVFWKGFENNKLALYDSIDVIVAATTNDEPFALVALEAGMYKVPAIATISGGFPESIVNNVTGYLVPKNAPDAIAEKLQTLYNDSNLLKEMGEDARKNIVEKFTSEIMASKLRGLIG